MKYHTLIRSFHSSALLEAQKHSSNTEHLIFPLRLLNPISNLSEGHHFEWCAEWDVGVGTVRARKRPSFGCLIFILFASLCFYDDITNI